MLKIQSPAKIACIQMRISYCRVEENLAEADRLIEAACANGATLLILPETFTTGSAFDTRAEAYAVAEAIPDGRTSQFLLKKHASMVFISPVPLLNGMERTSIIPRSWQGRMVWSASSANSTRAKTRSTGPSRETLESLSSILLSAGSRC